MSKRISWFHFAGLVHCSLYVLCCSQSFLVICFWVILSKGLQRIKGAEMSLENLSGVLLVSPFGSKHGYLGTYSPSAATQKIVPDTFWLEQMLGSQEPRATRYRSYGRRWGRLKKIATLSKPLAVERVAKGPPSADAEPRTRRVQHSSLGHSLMKQHLKHQNWCPIFFICHLSRSSGKRANDTWSTKSRNPSEQFSFTAQS